MEPEALTLLAREAMVDIAHLLRPAHLQQLRNILDDKEASPNDKFVALELLKNANIAAGAPVHFQCTATLHRPRGGGEAGSQRARRQSLARQGQQVAVRQSRRSGMDACSLAPGGAQAWCCLGARTQARRP